MIRLLTAILLCCAALVGLNPNPSLSREASESDPVGVWTAIIPDTFPHYVYTWHLDADGTYREDGRDAETDAPIQPTLHGHWRRDGARMILRQDGLPYVFDGVLAGDLYAGTMNFDGRFASRFCATKGDELPDQCSAPPGVARLWRGRPALSQTGTQGHRS